MSDIYVTYQYEDKLMREVTHCAPLDPLPGFSGNQHCSTLIILLVANQYIKK